MAEDECNDIEKEISGWENYDTGLTSKMMSKYAYPGKGLGKCEDRIVEPIIEEAKTAIGDGTTKSRTGFDILQELAV